MFYNLVYVKGLRLKLNNSHDSIYDDRDSTDMT